MADAEPIVEAASRPTMRFVEVKTPEQQSLGMVFRLRDLLIGKRTETINVLRGHLAEYGVDDLAAPRRYLCGQLGLQRSAEGRGHV